MGPYSRTRAQDAAVIEWARPHKGGHPVQSSECGTHKTVKAIYKTVKAIYKTVNAIYNTVKAIYKTVKAIRKTVKARHSQGLTPKLHTG